MKKIRVISDLHLDVNSGYDFKLPRKDVFTVMAGDTAGDTRQTIEWVKKQLTGGGILVSGNHLVYNRRGLSIEDLRRELANAFPVDGKVTYLDPLVGACSKEVDGILFLGACLYTDMQYTRSKDPKGALALNCRMAERYMNDFRYGRVDEYVDGEKRRMSALDYTKWFAETIKAFDAVLTENEKLDCPKPVVVITHHGPSSACVGGRYVESDLNGAYVSDLDDFIKRHKSIKCWVYGHIHEQKVVKIWRDDGSVCTLVNNSRGYCSRVEDEGFNVNTFINTDTWEVEHTPISQNKMNKMRKRLREHSMKIAAFSAWGFF